MYHAVPNPNNHVHTMPCRALFQELLAMVPQPVLAVLMCYPITDDTEAADKAGACAAARPSAPSEGQHVRMHAGMRTRTNRRTHARTHAHTNARPHQHMDAHTQVAACVSAGVGCVHAVHA
eukprot:363680-Chlamydomonas_euryale.AAC.7